MEIVQIGLGPLGQKVVKYALERKTLKITAAVDPAPDKAGRDLGELCGLPKLGITISPDLPTALKNASPKVAVLTTVSSLAKLESQLLPMAEAGLSVVSTCEELSFPWEIQSTLATRIDQAFKKHGVACVGTGVNPGYLMDFLPAVLSGICQRVDTVKVRRIQDASVRRVPFQQKIGAGLTTAQFAEKVRAGTLRHVGLTESMRMIAHHLGWKLDRVTEDLNPVLADREITSGYAPISKGMACGVRQTGHGFQNDQEIITLEFRAAVGEPESFDRVEISGEPNIISTIPGGINGDVATCAITLNAIRSIRRSAPGLRTMVDMYPIGYTCDFNR